MDRPGPAKPSEKRKVGGSTPPLTTPFDQARCFRGLVRAARLTATLAATVSSERVPELPKRVPLLFQGHVRVDRHRDLNVRMAHDIPHHMRWHAKIKRGLRCAPPAGRRLRPASGLGGPGQVRADPNASADRGSARLTGRHLGFGGAALPAVHCPARGRRVQGAPACGLRACERLRRPWTHRPRARIRRLSRAAGSKTTARYAGPH
jgi:hypothetical protein